MLPPWTSGTETLRLEPLARTSPSMPRRKVETDWVRGASTVPPEPERVVTVA